jgi:sugar lactone lactonase YvrE
MKRATQARYLGVVAVGCFFFTSLFAQGQTIFVSNEGLPQYQGVPPYIEEFNSSGTGTVFASGYTPGGLAFDSSGNLYVANEFAGTILKYDSSGTGTVFASGLNFPEGVAFDSSGNLYVATAGVGAGTIEKFNSSGTGSLFATNLPMQSFPIAVDSRGNVYSASFLFSGTPIWKFDPNGNQSVFVTNSASLGLRGAAGMACDSSGDLYVSYETSNVIEKFDSSGNGTVFASGVGNTHGLAFDSNGNLYATYGNGIEKFNSNGNMTVFADFPTAGLYNPTFIAVAPVPEPATDFMVAVGIIGLLASRYFGAKDRP